jgi:hypothetical protein
MSLLNVGTLSTDSGVKLPAFSSSNRPAGPNVGMLIYNTTSKSVEYWSGSSWSNFTGVSTISATGGTQTTVGVFRIHTFTGDGTFTVSSASAGATVEILIVGGGAGGGSDMGGGGGSGGVIYNPAYPISAGTYGVTIGGGGPGYPDYGSSPRAGGQGGNTIFGSLIAYGGGGGSSGHYYDPGEWPGIAGPQAQNGASGGGGSAAYRSFRPDYGGGRPPGKGLYSQGTGGGFGSWVDSNYYAGGGGGSGGNGEVDKCNGIRPGIGGPGTYLGITGTNLYWAGGGGGGAYTGAGQGRGGLGGGGGGGRWDGGGGGAAPGGTGGLNPGGNGGASPASGGGAGGTNTGSGGGGGAHQGPGGSGGSGIVVVRYLA